MATVWDSVRSTLTSLGRDTVDFLYPPVCVRCGVACAPSRGEQSQASPSRQSFCEACYDLLQCRIDQACLTCGAPVGPHLQNWGCRHCRNDRFAFERVFALGVYEQELKTCCGRVKEPAEAPLAAGLSELLWEAHQELLADAEIDVVVPVPHHWWERICRRDLPPTTIGRVLARRLSIPMTSHILAKRRRTSAQTKLSPSQRRKNLRRAFCLRGGAKLDGLSVLLTDDILTTGTTADRAARVLVDAGAARVLVAVFARGIGQTTGS